jgi:hypothetical protein
VGVIAKSSVPFPNNPGGHSVAYTLDEIPQPEQTFYNTAGITYRFNTTGLSPTHPIYISTDIAGENVSEWTEGLAAPSPGPPPIDSNNAANGTWLYWTPLTETRWIGQPGLDFFYQCRQHSNVSPFFSKKRKKEKIFFFFFFEKKKEKNVDGICHRRAAHFIVPTMDH